MGPVVAAVDVGASSIRVCRVDLGSRPPQLAVIHRQILDGVGEATTLGNALVQGVALGCYRDLADARAHLEQDPP